MRSAKNPEKRNQHVKFDNITDKFLDKQDEILGMSETKKIKRTGKPIKENISEHTRSSQEPISNRTRHKRAFKVTSDTISYEEIVQDISSTISNKGIVNELKLSFPESQQQPTEGSINNLRSISRSLKCLHPTIK